MILLRFNILACIMHLTIQNIVSIAQGKVRGVQKIGYTSYTGIPYAALNPGPIGKFKRGNIAPVWADIRNPHESYCSSTSPVEECLQLDINVPLGSSLPVLVWVTGSSGRYNPKALVKEGIIVVIVRHRLGPHGFLCSNENNIPGNAGLKDVVLALRWVRDNIIAFHGNPNKVTVAGQSFGAAIVESLMLTNAARGLYHGVILQSGTVLAPWAFNFDAEDRARLLIKSNSSRQYMIKASAAELTAKAEIITLPYLPFGLCIEGIHRNEERLISESPFDILSRGLTIAVPMIIGYANNEAYIFAATLKEMKVLRRLTKDKIFLLPTELQSSKRDIPKLMKTIDEIYFSNNLSMEAVMSYYRDAYFLSHIYQSVLFHASTHRPIYFYQFSYHGNIGVEEEPGMRRSGAAHSDELSYLFPDQRLEMHGDDGIVQTNLVRLWTNFVKHLNPTPADIQENIWKPFDLHNLELLDINTELQMVEYPFKKESEIWGNIYEKYYFDKKGRRIFR